MSAPRPILPAVCGRIESSTVILLILSALLLGAAPGRAQILHLDPIPWQADADSTSRLALIVEASRFVDHQQDWNVDRLLLTVILPNGEDGIYFLRMPHLTFDSGDQTATERWPGILGPGTPEGWPHSNRVRSFGQLEVGAVSRFSFPLLGGVGVGAALGLPVGVDRLYPFSSISLPLRAELRKELSLAGALSADFTGGMLMDMDSGGEELAPEAFPGGKHLGVGLGIHGGRSGRLRATWDLHDREGRMSRLVGIEGWLPWTADGSLGLKISHELEDRTDRPALWYFTAAWRFDSSAHRLAPAAPGP